MLVECAHTNLVPTPVEDISRRGLLVAPLTAALFAACRGGSERGEQRAATSESGQIRIEHIGGVTDVPRGVQRIVTLDGYVDLLTLLTLGVTPVLAGAPANLAEAYPDRVRGIQLAPRLIPDTEAIVAARPELILSADHTLERHAQLAAIAPTVLLDRVHQTPDDHLRLVGRALERLDEAERAIRAYEQRFAAVAGAVTASRLATIRFGMLFETSFGGNVRIFGPGSYAGRMLTGLGATGLIDPGKADGPSTGVWGEDISVERLNMLAPAELILVWKLAGDTPVRELPTWQRLPAVQAGRIVEVSHAPANWYQEHAVSRMVRLDEIERLAKQFG
jgi:iron complex transport system substrate-binding protein